MCFLSVLYSATTENNFEENNFAIDYKNGQSVLLLKVSGKTNCPSLSYLLAVERGIFF